ncbi:hypothetical protein [Brucella sp. LJL56]
MAMSSKTIATVSQVHKNPLIPSDHTHPDGESCDEQAYRNERQNVVDEIGHVGNSSVFTYVYFLFHFCSEVNTRSGAAFILGFTNSEYTTTDGSLRRRETEGESIATMLHRGTPPAAAPQDEVLLQ